MAIRLNKYVDVTSPGGGIAGALPEPAPPIVLQALMIEPDEATVGEPFEALVYGRTIGSTLSLTGAGALGLGVNSATGMISGTPTTEGDVNVVETLVGASNSPRTTLAAASTGGGGLNQPRIGLIGPSLLAQNTWRATSSPYGLGNADVGPLVWALMFSRRMEFHTRAHTSSPYYKGDNQAIADTDYLSYPFRIAELITEMDGVANWGAWYDVGRNKLDAGWTALRDATISHVGLLRTGGAKFLLISALFNRQSANGGDWAAGGIGRSIVADYNTWLFEWVEGQRDLHVIDFPSVLHDPGSAIDDPYSWATRSDGTHLTSLAAERVGLQKVVPVIDRIARSRSYPDRPVGSLLTALEGTSGTKVNVTGVVADGYTATKFTAGASVVDGSKEVINDEEFQVFTISNTSGVSPANRVELKRTSNIVVPEGALVKFRARVLISLSAIPVKLWALLGGSAGNGAAAQSRAYGLAAIADNGSDLVLTPGASFTPTQKFDPEIAHDLWIESSSYVLGDTGGSSVAFAIALLFGAGGASDTVVVKIGQLQTFPAQPTP